MIHSFPPDFFNRMSHPNNFGGITRRGFPLLRVSLPLRAAALSFHIITRMRFLLLVSGLYPALPPVMPFPPINFVLFLRLYQLSAPPLIARRAKQKKGPSILIMARDTHPGFFPPLRPAPCLLCPAVSLSLPPY